MSRRSSPIWSFFTVINSTNKIAKCDICKTDISFKSSVSNLKRHMIKKHPTIKIGGEADVLQQNQDFEINEEVSDFLYLYMYKNILNPHNICNKAKSRKNKHRNIKSTIVYYTFMNISCKPFVLL